MSKNTRTRILLVAVASLLLVTMAVGSTMAWLQDVTKSVKNEFIKTGIDIELTETIPEGEEKWEMEMIPGTEKDKNPTVTVDTTKTTVPIYVFVKVDETKKPANLTYELNLSAQKFQLLDATNYPGVWYRVWDPETDKYDYSWNILKDNIVKVLNTVEATNGEIAGGELVFQAWAIQRDYLTNANGDEVNTALGAWELVKDTQPATI